MERRSQSQLLLIKLRSSAEAEPALNNTWLGFPYSSRWSPDEDMGSNVSAHLQTSHLHLSCFQGFLTRIKTENIRKWEPREDDVTCFSTCLSLRFGLSLMWIRFRNDIKKQWEWATDNGNDVEQVLFSDQTGKLIRGNRNHPFSFHKKDKS